MPENTGLRHGALSATTAHLCVDMQRMFAEDTNWRTPWMRRVLPQVVQLCEKRPAETWFTRFIPVQSPGDGRGTWRRYYQRWSEMTLDLLGAEMVGLLPELELFVPPARVIDKHAYSPWFDRRLQDQLSAREVDTLVISGGETDICVLATVLGAIDHGYRVVVATDALCSSANKTHEATLDIYNDRFGQQLETASVAEIIEAWA
ncbi:MAG: cysteine hydrolase [Pseudomonadota bacterium]